MTHYTETESLRLRLSQPIDIIAAIPYLLGYHPADSVTVLALDGRTVVFCARIDLTPADTSEDELRTCCTEVARTMRDTGALAALVVGYGEPGPVDPAMFTMLGAIDRLGLDVYEALRVADGRYWSYACQDPRCCPPEGVAFDVSSSQVAAAATLAGRAVLPDRQTFEAQITPVTGPGRESMRDATAHAHTRLRDLIADAPDESCAEEAVLQAAQHAVDAAFERYREGHSLSDDEAAWLSVLLDSETVFQMAWLRLAGPSEVVRICRALWLDVMRRAEPDLIAGPGCLFAFATWRCGNSALAALAVERVREQHPDYFAAVLLDDALRHGLAPPDSGEFDPPLVSPRRARRPRRRSSSRHAGSPRG